MTKLVKFDAKNELLVHMGFSEDAETQELVEDSGVPRIFNFTKGGSGVLKDAIRKDIPDVEEGDPVLSIDGKFIPLDMKEVRYVVFPNFLRQFWADRDTSKKALIRSTNERKKSGAGKKPGTTGWQENIVSLMLVCGATLGDEPIMPIPTVSTLDKSRCPFLIGARKALKRANTKEWASDDKKNAELVAKKTPVALRVSHRIKSKNDTASHGMKYAKWTADSQTASPELVKEIQECMSDPEWAARFNEAVETYKDLVAKVEEKLQ